ncbi:hypothetical protein THH46_16325 [Pseudomonas sp. NA13]
MKLKFSGPLYRHVTQEKHAQDFISGKYIRLSTFESCRKYELSEQGDPEEGFSIYSHSPIASSHPDFNTISTNLGIVIKDSRLNVVMAGNERVDVIPDAYVLCMSYRMFDERLASKFGNYCISIADIFEFSSMFAEALRSIVPLKTVTAGPVEYRQRRFKDFEIGPRFSAYTKPADPFSIQREFRIVAVCEEGHKYEPFGLQIPNLGDLCRYKRLHP